MSQPQHTGPKIINGDLRAAWLPDRSCWTCSGSGNRQAFHGGFVVEVDGEPCEDCGGTGLDVPELDHDRYPETLQAMREEHRGDRQ